MRRLIATFVLMLFLVIVTAGQDRKTITVGNATASSGKPSITAEAGYAGTVETDDLNALVNGRLSGMRYLKMLPGQATMVERPVWLERVVTLASEQTGMFYPLVKRGTYVEEGMKVGYVTDYVGKVIFEARAPVAGVVLYVCAVPSMTKGATIASIGVIASPQQPQTRFAYHFSGTVSEADGRALPRMNVCVIPGERPINGRIPCVKTADHGSFGISVNDIPDKYKVCASTKESPFILSPKKDPSHRVVCSTTIVLTERDDSRTVDLKF